MIVSVSARSERAWRNEPLNGIRIRWISAVLIRTDPRHDVKGIMKRLVAREVDRFHLIIAGSALDTSVAPRFKFARLNDPENWSAEAQRFSFGCVLDIVGCQRAIGLHEKRPQGALVWNVLKLNENDVMREGFDRWKGGEGRAPKTGPLRRR